MKKRNIAIPTLITLSLLSLSTLIISPTSAKPTVTLSLTTDKYYYKQGETGKLHVTVRNEGPGPIEIKTITVKFPWHGWYHNTWEGNETKTNINEAISENNASSTHSFSFTIPTEGRILLYGGQAWVKVEYTWGTTTSSQDDFIPIRIETPVTQSENLAPILYLTAATTILLALTVITLILVWRRLGKLTPTPPAELTSPN